jgi:WD40 repeat protein/3',5'-cyclic AMP phosphodiesterase CpdA
MSRSAGARGTNGPIQVFVSYSPADERWATWMAWELEAAGYRTMLQAWDFVPGTNFIDFMDRGLSQAAAVVAVLSEHYLNSTYGRLEWQAALRADPGNPPGRLITVRVEDCPLEGLLATITYIDLVGVTDPGQARELLLDRIGHALAGRAKQQEVSYPHPGKTIAGEVLRATARPDVAALATPRTRRAPATAPSYPPALPGMGGPRSEVTLLHVAGPRFGRGLAASDESLSAADLQARIWADVTQLSAVGLPRPDLVVVTGDLTESGGLRECEEALTFLTGLRALLSLEAHRVVIVPGSRDITKAACRAYFATCEADDVEPQPPYWPKWRHFASLFGEFYRGLEGPEFGSAQPWTLFTVPDLRVAVAALNSTMAGSHRPEDDYGWIGEAQAAWFAERLSGFERAGWLRLGVIRHDPAPGGVPAGRDAALLRDAGTLDRLLGPRLSLLLHGPGPGGNQTEQLASGLLVVPAAAAGRHQFLRLTPDGMDRWGGHHPAGGDPVRQSRQWPSTGGTFSAGEPRQEEETGGEPPPPEPDRPASPASMLLDRITEVCEARYEQAKIRRVEGELPHLLITHQEDGFIRQWRIAAHVGEPARDELAAFLRLVHTGQPEPGSELVYDGAQPPQVLRAEALRRGVRLRSFIEFQGLLDLRGYVAGQTARLNADPLYPASLYVPQRYRELDRPAPGVRDDLADELLRQVGADHGRFILVLGDFGRGKTFALHELARRIPAELPHLIPLLIELRALDKAHSVDGLVAAHLANHGEDLIDLKAFRYMLREGRIVLLFDGFDELVTRVTYERAADHLDTLVRAAEGKAKIVVASRTQHFKSHEQVLTALGERVGVLPSRRVLAIEDFTPAQIRAYLIGRYDGDEQAADDRLRLLRGIQDLLGLSSNPRMLSFIADLDESRLRSVAGTQQAVSAAALYQEILRTWLSYEEQRTHPVPGAPVSMKLDDLWQAVTALAMSLWEAGESFLRLTALTEVADTLSGLADGRLSPGQRAHTMGAGSLLVRTDAGLFGFIHSSVAEWLVAAEIGRQLSSGVPRPAPLAARPLSQLTVDFLCDLAGSQAGRAWAGRILADPGAGEVARANAIKITTRLRTPVQTDLRGALLQGEDLSHRELAGVDLTGADLTDVLLVGANLSGAILRDARLVGARLDEARLDGADLRGADLTRARMARADLRGAALAGSRWVRAALIDVTADAGLAGAPELRGAAITPGQPVEVELAPAAIGVPYGFHPQTSRLPEPVAYSGEGGLLAIGSEDGGVLICDASSGLPVRTLHGHRGRVYAVAFAAADSMLATGSSDGTVRLWDPDTGKCLRVLEGHRDGVWPMALHPGGGMLVTGDGDGVLRLWDAGSGRLRRTLPGHTAPVYTAAFSPDGAFLAVGDMATLRVYDASTGDALRELGGHHGPVYRAAFSPAGDVLATGDRGGMVRLWDPASGELRHELSGHSRAIYTLAFHPAGSRLASGDTDGRIRLWDPRTGHAAGELAGHRGAVYWVVFSPGGDLLASCDSDGNVQLWDAATGQARHLLAGHKASVWPMVFRPDGSQLATSGNDGTVRLWDPAGGQCRHVLRGHGRRITEVRFSPAGNLLATSGNDGVVRLWQPRTGQRLRELTGTADRLISAIFSPADDRLATASNDGGVYFWNTRSGAYEREMNVETDHLWAEAFSPDGDVLATANDDDTVRLWYCTTGRCIRTFAEHRGRVRSIAFSPDGTQVATGCDDRAVRLWDVERDACVATLAGHTDRVYSVTFSPDGTVVATASNDGTARLWDVASGSPIRTLTGNGGRLWSAAFSPDGATLATAGDDLAVRLWDASTGAHLHTLTGHSRRVWSVAFSPDGALLASAGDDGSVGLWDTSGSEPPRLRLTLLGLPEGWAALASDGRYKQEGDIAGQFWHVVGMCRFGSGELDSYLTAVRRLPLDAEF